MFSLSFEPHSFFGGASSSGGFTDWLVVSGIYSVPTGDATAYGVQYMSHSPLHTQNFPNCFTLCKHLSFLLIHDESSSMMNGLIRSRLKWCAPNKTFSWFIGSSHRLESKLWTVSFWSEDNLLAWERISHFLKAPGSKSFKLCMLRLRAIPTP